ncbi:MAG TPA: hypothetical protein VG848_05620 [Acetobacteraceae bacterium]|nr:hypothetical protein [Acetobacteraceae bacterium]
MRASLVRSGRSPRLLLDRSKFDRLTPVGIGAFRAARGRSTDAPCRPARLPPWWQVE